MVQIETAREPRLDPLQSGTPEREMHFLDFLTVLSKHKRFILLFTCIVVIMTTITVLVLPSKFTAKTVLLLPGQNLSIDSSIASQLASAAGLGSLSSAAFAMRNVGDLYVALFQSRTVEDAVITRFHLQARFQAKSLSAARDAFEGRTKVKAGDKNGLLTITFTDRDPHFASDVANGYVEEFRRFSADLAITEASQRRVFFQDQFAQANEKLAEAEDALKATQSSTGVLQIDGQTRSLIESAAAIRAQIVTAQVQLERMRAYATDDNPAVVETKQQIAALRDQLSKLVRSDKGNESNLIELRGRIPDAELQYIRKLRDVKYYETMRDLLAKQLEIAKLDEARQGTQIQVVDLAVPPEHRSFPKRTISVIAAFFLGLLISGSWVFAKEGLARMMEDPESRRRLDAFRSTL